MLTRDFMSPPPPCVRLNTSASDIIRVMQDLATTAVMVMADDGSLAGIVSEGDLLRRKGGGHPHAMDQCLDRLAAGEPLNLEFLHTLQLKETTAVALMSSPAITVDEHASLSDVAGLMLRHGINHLPVTRSGKLVGLVSRRGLLCALAKKKLRPHPADKSPS